MDSLGNDSTPRERLSRLLTLLWRARMFWRSALAIALVGSAVSLVVALRSKRIYRSETTVLYRDGIASATNDGESATQRSARLGPKLKDLLYARPNLEQVIREGDLFPEKTSRSMLDGIEEMATAVGFRARASDSYVISFSYEDPTVAQRVAARLAERMIETYDRQNLDAATLTRNFLRKKLEEATAAADDRSRALATFLAEHPQFQWGGADSPYAPLPTPSAAPLPRAPRGAAPTRDPALRALERDLARVEAELTGGAPKPPMGVDAPRQREAAAAALSAAEAALAEKLLSVTPAHPDALAAEARVAAARQALAAIDAPGRAARDRGEPRAARDLTPERRAALLAERAALRRQMEARRGATGTTLPRAGAEPGDDVIELETEWHRLRLALDRARAELATIQQNARAADLSADAVAKQGREEMQILEPAYLPMRPDRGRGRVFLIGATITVFLAVGWAAARVLLDDTLRDAGDLIAVGGPPVLVLMPHAAEPTIAAPARAVVPAERHDEDGSVTLPRAVITPPPPGEEPTVKSARGPCSSRAMVLCGSGRYAGAIIQVPGDDPDVEVLGVDVDVEARERVLAKAPPGVLAALRVLRHRLEQRRADGSLVVSVVSPGPGEGKTMLAIHLALTLAEADRARVILVEGSFVRPCLASSLGLRLPPAASFSAQLRERMSGRGVPWGVVRLGPSIALLAEPTDRAACPEAIHSTHFQAAISALRRGHEYVVIDGPAILGSGDANVIEAVSDAVLLVVRAGSTRGAALTQAMAQLGSQRVMGAVLNDADGPAAQRAIRASSRSGWAGART